MLFRYHTTAGELINLLIPTEDRCYQVAELLNIDRDRLKVAKLSTDDVINLMRAHSILVAAIDDKPIGTIVLKRIRDHIVIRWVAVHQSKQRQRVGTALLKAASTGLSGKGYNIRAVVPEQATTAQQLLRSFGRKARIAEHGMYVFS